MVRCKYNMCLADNFMESHKVRQRETGDNLFWKIYISKKILTATSISTKCHLSR